MQIMINVPDNLPMTRATQRIKELEQSLREEASFLSGVLAKNTKQDRQAALLKIAHDCAALPTLDERSPDEILGYSDSPEGLWGQE